MRIMINGMWKRCELLRMSCATSGKHPRTALLAPDKFRSFSGLLSLGLEQASSL